MLRSFSLVFVFNHEVVRMETDRFRSMNGIV
jgi:hypothetical protein